MEQKEHRLLSTALRIPAPLVVTEAEDNLHSSPVPLRHCPRGLRDMSAEQKEFFGLQIRTLGGPFAFTTVSNSKLKRSHCLPWFPGI